MRGTLEVISLVLITISTFWIIGVGVLWLYNKGELAAVPLVDRNFAPSQRRPRGGSTGRASPGCTATTCDSGEVSHGRWACWSSA